MQTASTILDAKNSRGQLIDLATNTPIRFARWANLETGEFEAFRADPKEAKRLGVNLCELLYRRVTRLQFIPSIPSTVSARPATCQGVHHPGKFRRFLPVVPMFDRPCQHPACLRAAAWLVADEMQISPLVWNGRKFERALTKAIRYYCDWHYQPPRIFDECGELIGTQEVLARPA